MIRSKSRVRAGTHHFTRAAFTLLELLVVVAILAVLAGTAIMALNDTQAQVEADVAQTEMLELKQAILRFQRDTGWLPKQGPFNLDSRPGGFAPLPAGASEAWFDSPANFWQLYENPLGGTGHPLETWNPATRRGWNGPYLTRGGEGLVSVGDNLQRSGDGTPSAGNVVTVYGVADTHARRPLGAYYVWQGYDGTVRSRFGRPILLLDIHHEDPQVRNARARLVGHGPNGIYESSAATVGGDDVLLELFR